MHHHYAKCFLIVIAALFLCPTEILAQCQTDGVAPVDGVSGSDSNYHLFPNRCLAQPGTEVTIVVEAMADLGCFAFDATHDPPSGSGCPDECASPLCCDTDPEDKYLTVSANGNWLSPAITGSTNMPASGRFFAEWVGNCTPYSDTCNEAGRSLCYGAANIFPNRRVVTVPASVWNSWLGAGGNT